MKVFLSVLYLFLWLPPQTNIKTTYSLSDGEDCVKLLYKEENVNPETESEDRCVFRGGINVPYDYTVICQPDNVSDGRIYLEYSTGFIVISPAHEKVSARGWTEFVPQSVQRVEDKNLLHAARRSFLIRGEGFNVYVTCNVFTMKKILKPLLGEKWRSYIEGAASVSPGVVEDEIGVQEVLDEYYAKKKSVSLQQQEDFCEAHLRDSTIFRIYRQQDYDMLVYNFMTRKSTLEGTVFPAGFYTPYKLKINKGNLKYVRDSEVNILYKHGYIEVLPHRAEKWSDDYVDFSPVSVQRVKDDSPFNPMVRSFFIRGNACDVYVSCSIFELKNFLKPLLGEKWRSCIKGNTSIHSDEIKSLVKGGLRNKDSRQRVFRAIPLSWW